MRKAGLLFLLRLCAFMFVVRVSVCVCLSDERFVGVFFVFFLSIAGMLRVFFWLLHLVSCGFVLSPFLLPLVLALTANNSVFGNVVECKIVMDAETHKSKVYFSPLSLF